MGRRGESGGPLAQGRPGKARLRWRSAYLVLALGAPAARAEGVPAVPIPQNPSDLAAVPGFTGAPAVPRAVPLPTVPQNPFMAPNGRSNLHDDAYMTNTYTWSAPLGNSMQALSTFQGADCASLTVDSAGRLVTVCVGLEGPRLVMLDPQTLELLAAMPLPPRSAEHRQPLHRILRRRLLLPRPERPRRDPDGRRPDLGRGRDRRRHRPGLRARTRLRPRALPGRRRQDHLGAARLERADLVRHDQGRRRHRRPGHAAR